MPTTKTATSPASPTAKVEPEQPSTTKRHKPVVETDGRGKVTRYTYDQNGNLTGKYDPNGTLFSYTYYETNLLKTLTAVNGPSTQTKSYTYDEAGITKTATDGTLTHTYNIIDGSYTPDPYGLVSSDTVDGRTTEYQ